MTRSYYEVLGVSAGATTEDLKIAYRKAAQLHHPDHGGDQEEMKVVNEAYEVLCDPMERASYDAWLKESEPQTIPTLPPHRSRGSGPAPPWGRGTRRSAPAPTDSSAGLGDTVAGWAILGLMVFNFWIVDEIVNGRLHLRVPLVWAFLGSAGAAALEVLLILYGLASLSSRLNEPK